MLRFRDFAHLPQIDGLVAQLSDESQGLVLIAGLDPRPLGAVNATGMLPSGRGTVFRALAGELLEANTHTAIVVAENRDTVRVPRPLQRRVKILSAQAPHTYAEQIRAAIGRSPDLLVVDRLDEASAPAAFSAARSGLRVISQLDTVCRGAEVARHLRDLGVPPTDMEQLRWVITIQRLPRLCPHCSEAIPLDPQRLERLRQLRPTANRPAQPAPWDAGANPTTMSTFDAHGCRHCEWTGRQGDVAAFDVYHASGASTLPLEHYLWYLIEQGALALGDLLDHDSERLYRTYRLLSASAHSLTDTNATLQRKLLELEAANQVLQQRTAALSSLQEVGQALTQSASLADLARRVCRNARDLCGADRAILYLVRPDHTAEVLAANGWDASLIHQQLDLELIGDGTNAEPTPYTHWPPGIPEQVPDLAGFEIRAGLRVPLLAEQRLLGLMIMQSTQKSRFTPAEIALLRAFADQSALAIQRAELIDTRIRQERLEHELELARQVQQSVLPQIFPHLEGFSFGACNQPARQVGGDFYDVFMLDDQQIGVVIGDVSGKGMPAALYMALTRSLLLAEARRERSPRRALLNVNHLLREIGDPHLFVTVFYGVIDAATRRVTYARAGHDYPLVLRDGEIIALGGRGIVLGLFEGPEMQLSEEQIDLQKSDRMVLYTDGLTDVLRPDGQRFELAKLKRIFQSHATLAPEALCTATFADLTAYQSTAEQFDDMTLLVIGVE